MGEGFTFLKFFVTQNKTGMDFLPFASMFRATNGNQPMNYVSIFRATNVIQPMNYVSMFRSTNGIQSMNYVSMLGLY